VSEHNIDNIFCAKSDAAAQKAAQNKTDKYTRLSNTHIFYPSAIEKLLHGLMRP